MFPYYLNYFPTKFQDKLLKNVDVIKQNVNRFLCDIL